ncbi:MAG TPA: LysM peptidoglycan-binding domain-containing protein [Anaerolineales bacterium]|nr:LysM peptidoglycan-binding domain-containing protein [Anaerolineales bacterium]
MSINRALAWLFLALLTIALAACELSASTPPPTTATTEGSLETLRAELGNISTQTAAAGGGAGAINPTAPLSTLPPADATAVPPSPENTTPGSSQAPAPVPATNTPIVAPAATPGLPKDYKLQEGEFPFCIARRFNVDIAELLSINGLGSQPVLPVGYTLKIPQTGNKFAGDISLRDHPTTYTVAAGDTIYIIACKYGDVDPLVIAQINEIKKPYNLKAGEKISIP